MIQLLLTTCVLIASTANEPPKFDTTLNFHVVHQFDASINGGGDVGVTRSGFELRWDETITEIDDLAFKFQYQHDVWDFGGTTGLGGQDPFGSIDTVDFGIEWTHKYSEKTSWFFGTMIRSSYEHDFNEGLLWAGHAGLIHQYSSTLTLGVGAGIMGQVQDDARSFPVFIVNWEINPDLLLTSGISTRFGGRTGVELVWTGRDDWTLGVGIAYDYSRFSLDDSGIAPGGAGLVTSLPLSLRATYHASETFDITFLGGVVFAGRIEIIDQSGIELEGEDFDPAGTFGIFGQIKF